MVEMSCREHDTQAASTQFLTHTVGRMLGEMKARGRRSEGTIVDEKGRIHAGQRNLPQRARHSFAPSLQIEQPPIDTRGFQALVNLMHNTTNDSFDLYYGLFLYNPVRG